jgi:ABC-type glycerol-3-phosphate transport system permease component
MRDARRGNPRPRLRCASASRIPHHASGTKPHARRNRLNAFRFILVHAILLLAAIVSLAPLVWLVIATFKDDADMARYAFLPGDLSTLSLENYRALFGRHPFFTWVLNSVFLASAQTVVIVVLSSTGGFALAKYEFVGKRLLMGMMALTMLLPAQVLLPGSYELMVKIGWMDTYWAILVPGATSVFGMFLFMQAMKGVPDELLGAARVDGCSELRIWWEVALPIVRPMIGAFTLMTFLGTWNSFLWPQIVLQDEGKYTLPIGLANLLSIPESGRSLGPILAGTLLSILPVMTLFFALQRDFVSGLASGAVKG